MTRPSGVSCTVAGLISHKIETIIAKENNATVTQPTTRMNSTDWRYDFHISGRRRKDVPIETNAIPMMATNTNFTRCCWKVRASLETSAFTFIRAYFDCRRRPSSSEAVCKNDTLLSLRKRRVLAGNEGQRWRISP